MPRARAASTPAASARLEMTRAISASSFPAAIESAMASMFEPRPEIRIPSRCILFVNDAASANHFADGVPGLAQRAENFFDFGKLARRNHQDHTDPQVKRPAPIVFGNVSQLAQQLEYRQHRPGAH